MSINFKHMKRINILLCYLLVVFLITASCSSSKNLSAPKLLYKTKKGEEIAHRSYDKAMELWEIDYNEDYVETDYGKSHVIISGEENKDVLILLPGLFADACMWYPNVSELSKYYRVYTLDMLNYGGKSKPANKAIAEFEDYNVWFSQILNHYQIDSCSVAGLSYGSWLALALARKQPETFSSIILLDPSETFMPMNGGIAWKGFRYFMFFPNRKKYNKFFDWLGGGYSDKKIDIWTEHMLDVIEFGSVKMFDVPQHRIYKPNELKMLNMPVLIMAGGKPILYDDPEVFKTKAKNAIPQSDVIIIEGAGHGLNMEKPDIVNSEIIKFLRSVYKR